MQIFLSDTDAAQVDNLHRDLQQSEGVTNLQRKLALLSNSAGLLTKLKEGANDLPKSYERGNDLKNEEQKHRSYDFKSCLLSRIEVGSYKSYGNLKLSRMGKAVLGRNDHRSYDGGSKLNRIGIAELGRSKGSGRRSYDDLRRKCV